MGVEFVEYRLPYYMAYPVPLPYDDERIEQRDFEYMKSMYPETAKRLLPYVEDECDRMAYEGSMVYDEYPDQLQLRLMCNRIYEKVKDMDIVDMEQSQMQSQMEDAMESQQLMRGRNKKGRDDRLRDLIQVLVFQELFRRRSEHRRQGRRFY